MVPVGWNNLLYAKIFKARLIMVIFPKKTLTVFVYLNEIGAAAHAMIKISWLNMNSLQRSP